MRVDIQMENYHTERSPPQFWGIHSPSHLSQLVKELSSYSLYVVASGRVSISKQWEERLPSAPPFPRGPLVTSAVNSLRPINQQDQAWAHLCSCSCIRGSPNRKGHQAQTAEALHHSWIFPDFINSLKSYLIIYFALLYFKDVVIPSGLCGKQPTASFDSIRTHILVHISLCTDWFVCPW